MKRVFLASKAPDVIIELATLYKQKYANIENIKWTHPDDLHITILPPWHTESIKVIKNNFSLNSLNGLNLVVEFLTVEPGPKKGNPRLIWVQGNPSDDLELLRNDLYESHPELDKPRFAQYIPHVTIARGESSSRVAPLQIDQKVELSSLFLYETLPKKQPDGGEKYRIHDIVNTND